MTHGLMQLRGLSMVKEGLTALKKVTVLVQPASSAMVCGISQRITLDGTLISVT